MSGPFAEGTFAAFNNGTLTVSRPQGQRTAKGFERAGTETVLSCRADAQESGRSLERAQQLYETGDMLAFCSKGVAEVEPGDSITLDMDDGRTIEGSVEEVMPIDSSLLLSL
jgi:hypothetical protein